MPSSKSEQAIMQYSVYKHRLFHLVCYYIVWFVLLYFAAHSRASVGILIALIILPLQIFWQYRVAKDSRDFIPLILLLTLCGSLVDSAMIWLNLMIYHDNYFYPYFAPPWMIIQWLEFAIIVHALTARLWQRPILVGVLCLFGFPLAYISGAHLGAVTLVHGDSTTAIIGVIWMLLLPIIMWNHQRKVMQC